MGHYFDPNPSVRSRPRQVRVALPDIELDLASDAGVFSSTRLDPGTRLLLSEVPPPPPGGSLLDLGCGFGPIAIVMALRAPGCTVWATDVNARARELTRSNAAQQGFGARVRVVGPDELPQQERFAAIYSNPPARIGKTRLLALLVGALERLDGPEARAFFVINKHLGSDSIGRALVAEGFDVERLVSRAGYRILGVHRTG